MNKYVLFHSHLFINMYKFNLDTFNILAILKIIFLHPDFPFIAGLTL